MSSLVMLLHAGVVWPVSNSERRGGLLLVKLGRTQPEQMPSGLPSKANIARYSRHVSKVPTNGSEAARNHLYDAERYRSVTAG